MPDVRTVGRDVDDLRSGQPPNDRMGGLVDVTPPQEPGREYRVGDHQSAPTGRYDRWGETAPEQRHGYPE
jgi:hypothetical protein